MTDFLHPSAYNDDVFLPLAEELDRWRKSGLECRLWLRDDDLIADSDNFRRLIALMRKYDLQVMCSVIPALLDSEFAKTLIADANVVYVQHGYAHHNHELEGQVKSEFGPARPLAKRIADIRAGFFKLDRVIGGNFLKVFVPPWNHIDDELVPTLKVMGFNGLSRHGLQLNPDSTRSVRQFNTHIDITNWGAPEVQRTRPLDSVVLDITRTLTAKRDNGKNMREAIGILLHHRVMNQDSWTILEQLISYCKHLLCKPANI